MIKSDINVCAYTGSKIRYYRKEKKWTQKELGDKLGVKDNTISGWEHGKSEPLQNQLFIMAQLFGVSINDLFPPTTNSQTLNIEEQSLIEGYRSLELIDRGRLLERLQTLKEQDKYTAKAEKEKISSAS